jgi:tetratricopeptide (TPR) repeat protein
LIEALRHDDGVTSAAFSRDDSRILTSSFDKTARLWDSETGKALCDPLRHDQLVTSAKFSPDGKQIATASLDGAIRVWELFADNERFRPIAADLAESVGGIRLNDLGIPEPVRPNFLNTNSSAFTAWFFADRSTRAIAPSLAESIPAYVQRRIREGTATALEAAYRADPGNALVVASLAAQSDDREHALFYCRYAQANAGNDAEVWWTVAQALQKNGETEQALVAIDHALALRPNDVNYARFRASLVRQPPTQ